MGSAVVSASPAVGRLLRESRKRRGWTLKRVVEQCKERGQPIPLSTLAKIEQGRVDPGIRRLRTLLELYRIPSELAHDMVELEQQAAVPPEETDIRQLYERGVEYWKAGDLSQGLAHLMAIRLLVPDDDDSRELRQEATLAFAVLARNLGKYKLAKQLIDEMLCEPPAERFLLQVLVVASGLWRGSGSLEVALALIDRAERHIDPQDDRGAAFVYHQQAKLYHQSGQLKTAAQRIDQVLGLYEKNDDVHNAARALLLKAEILRDRGDLGDALALCRETIDRGTALSQERLVASASLELGRVQLSLGDVDEGLASLREGLATAVRLDDKTTQFYAHYYLWKAHEDQGDRERAAFERQAARYFVASVDELSDAVTEVQMLVD
ncbi:hypothetical protein ABI59_13380 [Acidobacteria bacterium Mor1]|nr:hypothetical protein ABI59_13380 [Acidobacteria bacterium Mor1]